MLVNVAFYLAPFVICLPCSGWMARLGYRSALLLALILAASGSVVIAVSLWLASFAGCLVGIFIVAMGVAAMQVVANPYVNRLGEAQSAAGRLSLASSINSLGAALAPVVWRLFWLALSFQFGDVSRFDAGGRHTAGCVIPFFNC